MVERFNKKLGLISQDWSNTFYPNDVSEEVKEIININSFNIADFIVFGFENVNNWFGISTYGVVKFEENKLDFLPFEEIIECHMVYDMKKPIQLLKSESNELAVKTKDRVCNLVCDKSGASAKMKRLIEFGMFLTEKKNSSSPSKN